MHQLLDQLSAIADKIKNIEESRERLGAFLKEIKDKIEICGEDVAEKKLVYKIEPEQLNNKKIAAIDGGLSQHAYHGLDMILIRAVAVACNYNDGKLENIVYYPNAFPAPKVVIISDPYSDDEFIVSSSLEREKEEIALAVKALKEFSPDLLLIDGSIIPHPSDKPSKSSPVYKRYQELIETFKKLYAASAGYLLAGCIEDSRATSFCEIVSEKILSQVKSPRIEELKKILSGTRDTNLLYHILEQNERSCIFKTPKNPMLDDLEEFGTCIYSFYLKTAEFDRPVRVDFFESDSKRVRETADKIASLVLALSCHSSYGFPAPLIEADMRAKFQEQDIDALHDQLVDRVGITPSLMKLRREQRPF